MSKKCTLIIKDQCNVKFEGLDPLIRRKFVEALKFMDPKARHTPQFKLKRWDGKVAFGTIGGGTYLNLLDRVLPMIYDDGYDIEIDDRRPEFNFTIEHITEDYLADRVWPEWHDKAGDPIMLRDYQVGAINRYIDNLQGVQTLTTAFGKTITTAALSLIVEKNTGGRTIVIVPSKDLVKQTAKTYSAVGLDVGVYYGDSKDWGHQHTICTWQSMAVFDKKSKKFEVDANLQDFLQGVNCVIADECHGVKGTELKALLCDGMGHIPIRWGMTGTMPKEDYQFMSVLSAVGPVVGEVRAKDLQDRGILASCEINIMQMQDDHVEFMDYDSESKFLLGDRDRIAWLADYCNILKEEGNTLVLVDRIETGKTLAKLIPDSIFVSGQMKSAKREEEYGAVRTATNKIIIATYGVASTGIDVPRIFNLVLVEPGKSFFRTIQSIGRSLRKAHDKFDARIFDFTSSLKFSRRHCNARKAFYKEAGYPFSVTKIDYRSFFNFTK